MEPFHEKNMIPLNKIINKDCIAGMKELPDNCVDCIVTSPPYFGLRDYGTATWEGGDIDCKHSYEVKSPYNENFNERYGNAPGQKKQESQRHEKTYKSVCNDCGAIRKDEQIGLEETPELYVAKMIQVFTEGRRVLKKEGTLWLNLGDSYAGSGRGPSDSLSQEHHNISEIQKPFKSDFIKPKDLIGIPWMVAFALRSSGWYLRQDIIWHKPNPMPESVTDRCTKAHEYIFLLSKSAKYYYNAESIATPYQDKTLTTYGCEVKGKGDGSGLIQSENWANSMEVRKPKVWKEKSAEKYGLNGTGFQGNSGNYDANGDLLGNGKANKRSVWTVTTQPYAEAHFATFPEDLIVDCIKAGCPEGGVVLDPFGGAGTTALVAAKLNCNYILFEIKKDYINISQKRLHQHLGFFNPAYNG